MCTDMNFLSITVNRSDLRYKFLSDSFFNFFLNGSKYEKKNQVARALEVDPPAQG
jgi:hypothetical protein